MGYYYHPKHCKTVSAMVGTENCEIYGVFNVASREWSITHLPQKVKENMTLYLRSREVISCINAPDQPQALFYPGVDESSNNHSSISQHPNCVAMYENDEPPPSSQSSTVTSSSDRIDSITLMDSDGIERYVAFCSFPQNCNSFECHFSLASCLSTASELSPTASTSASPKRGIWPLRYTCDMSRGFEQIDSPALKNLTLPIRFQMAFHCHYVKSTYCDNRNVWKNVPLHVRRASIAAGQTESGEWKKLVAKYGKPKTRK